MTPLARTTLTIGVLLLALLGAGAWGWHQVTSPLPTLTSSSEICTETPVKKDGTVTPEMVTISVLNAGKRSGLAAKTMAAFTQAGFHQGSSANAPVNTKVAGVEIWTDDPDSPAVALVKSRLRGAKVVQTAATQVGVTLVVGDKFAGVSKGKASVKSAKDTTICSPPASVAL